MLCMSVLTWRCQIWNKSSASLNLGRDVEEAAAIDAIRVHMNATSIKMRPKGFIVWPEAWLCQNGYGKWGVATSKNGTVITWRSCLYFRHPGSKTKSVHQIVCRGSRKGRWMCCKFDICFNFILFYACRPQLLGVSNTISCYSRNIGIMWILRIMTRFLFFSAVLIFRYTGFGS